MEGLLEYCGVWLARVYAAYGLAVLALPAAFFLDLALLTAVAWAAAQRARGRRAWPSVPGRVRRGARFLVEVKFGLINPALYLAVFLPAIRGLQAGGAWLSGSAWVLLAAFWGLRMFGAALDGRSRTVRAGVRTLLGAALGCVLLYAAKDARLLVETEWSRSPAFLFALNLARVAPLYLIPAVLLADYWRTAWGWSGSGESMREGFFLLPGGAARWAVAGVAGAALLTILLAAQRRSEGAVREILREHGAAIVAAAERYDVDPRLVASIVYVTHRDQLSPFRDALEHLAAGAWAGNLRRDFRLRPPDGTGEGADENPLLNRALDISVGLAQIKPRTAQTASVLATGRRPDELPKPEFFAYLDAEPAGEGWRGAELAGPALVSPIPAPGGKQAVARALLEPRTNLETCALILALYQRQWEAAKPEWSLRRRPEILATLYQIGFSRSRPHGAPRSNAFGERVRQVHGQPWLRDLVEAPATGSSAARRGTPPPSADPRAPARR